MIDINELRRVVQAAKDSCESVEWSHEFRSGRYSQGDIISGEENILIVCGANYGCWRDADDNGDSQFKALGDFVAAANPAAITELLDRLEAAESDALEQARLNGIGAEREAALLSKLEAAEKERDALRAALRHEADCVEAAKAEIAALRAKIERMGRQEPVKYEFQDRDGKWYPFIDQRHYENTVADGTWPIRSLYALPGAKGEKK